MKRVLCNATVDPERDADGGYIDYTVVVTGAGDHDEIVRKYTITDQTQKNAAMEGIRRFTEEVGE
jgi:hypothetical protein